MKSLLFYLSNCIIKHIACGYLRVYETQLEANLSFQEIYDEIEKKSFFNEDMPSLSVPSRPSFGPYYIDQMSHKDYSLVSYEILKHDALKYINYYESCSYVDTHLYRIKFFNLINSLYMINSEYYKLGLQLHKEKNKELEIHPYEDFESYIIINREKKLVLLVEFSFY